MDDATDQIVPSNLEAEQGLLGAMLVKNQTAEDVGFLRYEHFADPLNGEIFDAIMGMVAAGKEANPFTLKETFEGHKGEVQTYIVALFSSVVTTFNAKSYADTVYNTWMRRQIIDITQEARDLVAENTSQDQPAESIIEEIHAALDELTEDTGRRGALEHAVVGVDSAIETTNTAFRDGPNAVGITTQIRGVDRVLGPLRRDRYYIIGGRPAMGKTALCARLAWNLASAGHPVAFFSLEMGDEDMARVFISMLTGIERSALEDGRHPDGRDMDGEDFRKITDARTRIAAAPLYVDDQPASTVQEIQRRALRMKRAHGLALSIVDYIQLISPGNSARQRNNNRTNDVTEISQGLKRMSKDTDAPVIATSQLSRSIESRDDKRPTLQDLRESGSLEQDADVVAFCYREKYYLEQNEPEKRPNQTAEEHAKVRGQWLDRMMATNNTMQLLGRKNRSRGAQNATLFYDVKTGVITDLQQEEFDHGL